ncbi:hypothetical protein SAMN04488564_109313 [Lentzea waywayandensis]|uniref:Uncharacterized protein n=1 Tax=Lentzea waywayandensis TaxID=84724 RepID=A0A1I6F8Z4_9PSEU|nr:hypothetical protein SAMN04488564_109313 [Lentzea waywayandensis]
MSALRGEVFLNVHKGPEYVPDHYAPAGTRRPGASLWGTPFLYWLLVQNTVCS